METTKDRKKPRYTQDFSADLKSRDEDSAFAALGGESQKAGAALGGESQKAGAALGGESQKAGAALGGESQKAGAALGGESQKAGAALGGESQKAGAAAVRVIDPGSSDHAEQQWEHSLRPKSFDEFPGQENVKEKIKVFVEAARHRQEPLDHVLLSGPPGLGKTTLATIIANTMGVEIKTTSGPALDKKGDLAAILTSLKANSILFIDEIHRLSTVVEEYLYSAMEDYYIDIVTGDGLGARTMKFSLSPFTLVGATTRAGLLNAPFRDRFGIVERLSFYDKTTLASIITRSSGLLKTAITPEGAMEVAKRSRGTPRVANRLLKRVRDYAQVKSNGTIDEKLAAYALDQLEVDHLGLDEMDRKILVLIGEKFAGGPVGIETLSAALSEEKDTLEEVYEPFLIQEGLIQKTPRGRVITELAKRHLQTQTVTVRAE